MRKPTDEEINEFALKLGIIPNAYIGDTALKYALKEYCGCLVDGQARPLMTALYIDTSKYLNKVFPHSRGKGEMRSERNIRTAIEKVWKAEHTKSLDKVFSYYNESKQPTNITFISTCASYLLDEIDKKDKKRKKKEETDIISFEKGYIIRDDAEKETNKKLKSEFDNNIPEDIKNYIDETVSKIVKESVKEVLKYLLVDDN